jgi:hypothetical protein
MRSGLHGAPAKPVPGGDHENTASTPTRLDSDYDCARVGEQVNAVCRKPERSDGATTRRSEG